jgi:hypothetical protein
MSNGQYHRFEFIAEPRTMSNWHPTDLRHRVAVSALLQNECLLGVREHPAFLSFGPPSWENRAEKSNSERSSLLEAEQVAETLLKTGSLLDLKSAVRQDVQQDFRGRASGSLVVCGIAVGIRGKIKVYS